jgi:ABC-type lipoprotein release transport system permease subunit
MKLSRLILREIAYRKLNFGLGVFAVAVAVGCLVAELTVLRRHDLQTEEIVAAKEAETRARMVGLENDYRKLTLKMGFNVLILPKDQNLSDLYAEDYAAKYMPEEYATRLAKSRVATINHILPSLQQKVKWPERERTILLMGVRGEVYMQSAKQKALLEAVAPGTMRVGHELARNLQLKAGDRATLMGREYTVAQINPERGNKDDITVWIDLAEAQDLLGRPGRINAILALDCTCDTIDRLSRIRAEIAKILPDTQIIEFSSQAIARAEARDRAASEAAAAVEQEKVSRAKLRAEREASAAILVPVALLGAAVWIGFLAFGNVRERAVEIGILRALGLRSWQVLVLFLSRALVTGLVGAAVGYAGGVLATMPAMPSFQLRWLAAAVVGAPVLAALAGWLPAMVAARQDPAEVLSRE